RVKSIHAGQPVSVSLEALDRTLDARVSEIVPAVDAASRANTVKIDLPPLAQLRSGMFGRAVFSSGARNVLAVPTAAVTEHGQLQSVMVADGGYAHTRLITAGRKSGDRVEVLSGLSAGEKVVCPLPPGLVDGARVDRFEADAAGDRRFAAAGRFRGVEAAARGGAADRRADDRRVCADARRLGARSRRAGHQAHGEAAVGGPRRGVYLLDLQPRHVHGGGALPGGAE